MSISCSNLDASIQWRSTGDNRAPILHYIIQYNTSFTPDLWVNAFENVPATDMRYNLNLSPWSNYTFRVLAVNKVGPSLPSQHSDVCTTTPNVPFKNPDNVEGKGSEPNNLIISWKVTYFISFISVFRYISTIFKSFFFNYFHVDHARN